MYHFFSKKNQWLGPVFGLLLLSCFFGADAEAYTQKTDCGVPTAGKKFALFARFGSEYSDPVFDAEKNPKDAHADFCVVVDEGATSVTWQQLKAGMPKLLLDKDTQGDLYVFKLPTCIGDPSGDAAKQKPANVSYLLNKEVSCKQIYNTDYPRFYGFGWSKPGLQKDGMDYLMFIKFIGAADYCPKLSQADCGKQTACAWFGGSCVDKKVAENGGVIKDCTAVLQNVTCGPETCKAMCQKFTNCSFIDNACKNKDSLTTEEKQKQFTDAINKANTEKYKPPAESNFLPNCAYPGTCNDINDLLQVLINIALFLFKIIGTAAFAFFVYGGFVMIVSLGNADKVKQGRETMVAAVIGIIIAFSAYTLVDLVLDVLQVSNEYRPVGNLDLDDTKK